PQHRRAARRWGLAFRCAGSVDGVANLRKQDDDLYERPFDGLVEDRLPAVGLHVGLFEFARLKVSKVVDTDRHGRCLLPGHIIVAEVGLKTKTEFRRPPTT